MSVRFNHNAGSYAAYMQTVLWVSVVIFIVVINPSLGVASPEDLSKPNVLLPALASSPILLVFPGLDLLMGLSFVLVVLGMDAHLKLPVQLRYNVLLGAMAGMFFIALATNRLYTLPELAHVYLQNPTQASEQFTVLNATHDGVSAAIRLTMGLWLLLTNYSLVCQRNVRGFAYLGIVTGLLNVASTFFQPLAVSSVLLLPIWFYLAGRWMSSH